MGFVRVTLLKPYHEDHTQDILLRFGSQETAQVGVADPTDPREYVQTGRTGEAAARPNFFVLNWSNESQRDVLMPEEAAMLWFGDWRIQKDGSTRFVPGVQTFGKEKIRVALKWGDYIYPTPDRGQMFDLSIIGPPKVPHVRIQRVDQGGRVVGEWSFEPWAWFQWENEVNHRAAARAKAKEAAFEPQPSGVQGIDLSTLTPQQIEQLRALLLPQTKAKAS